MDKMKEFTWAEAVREAEAVLCHEEWFESVVLHEMKARKCCLEDIIPPARFSYIVDLLVEDTRSWQEP